MRFNIQTATVAVMLAIPSLALAGTGQSSLPVADPFNLPAYRVALERSDDPRAKTILNQISNGPVDLAKAKAAAIKDGLSLTADTTPIPINQDAGPIYYEWNALWQHISDSYPIYADPMTLRTKYTSEQIAAIQKIVDNRLDHERLLMRAVKMPYASVDDPVANHKGPVGTAASARIMRAAARQITTRATLLAIRRQWRSATLVQLSGFQIQKQMMTRPSLIGNLAAEAIEEITLQGCQNILSHTRPNVQISHLITSGVIDAEDRTAAKRSLQFEAHSILDALDEIKTGMKIGETSDVSKNVLSPDDYAFVNNAFDAAEANYLNHLRAVYEVMDETRMKRRADMDRIDAAINSKSDHLDLFVIIFGDDHVFSLFVKHDDGVAAREQETLAAAAVLSAKATMGVFPTQLPGNFIDPFSGNQLKYRTTDNGFIVYSVGPTGKYDGIKDRDPGWESSFTYPAPPSKPVPKELLN